VDSVGLQIHSLTTNAASGLRGVLIPHRAPTETGFHILAVLLTVGSMCRANSPFHILRSTILLPTRSLQTQSTTHTCSRRAFLRRTDLLNVRPRSRKGAARPLWALAEHVRLGKNQVVIRSKTYRVRSRSKIRRFSPERSGIATAMMRREPGPALSGAQSSGAPRVCCRDGLLRMPAPRTRLILPYKITRMTTVGPIPTTWTAMLCRLPGGLEVSD
jgi:hypothetical protein